MANSLQAENRIVQPCSCHSSAAPSPGNTPLPLGSPSLLRSDRSLHLQRSGVIHTHCRCCSLNPTQARCLQHLAAFAASICSIHSYPYFGDISAQDGRYLPVPSFGHHSIGPQRRTGRGVFTGVDLGHAIRLRTVGPEAPRHKVPRRLAGLGSLPRFPGVLLPLLCQANKRL